MNATYTITAGSNSTDLGRVGTANTIIGAKRIGRKAVSGLPNGEGDYKVRDLDGREIFSEERSIRTGWQWIESAL